MTDHLTPERRSWNMSLIRSKNSKPEQIVRSYLHKQGFRFRLYKITLPGKPDITLPRFGTVVFVNGCFWHRHPGCKRATSPKTHKAYWKAKLDKNVERLNNNKKLLQKMGWQVIEIWECEIRDQNTVKKRFARLTAQRKKE